MNLSKWTCEHDAIPKHAVIDLPKKSIIDPSKS